MSGKIHLNLKWTKMLNANFSYPDKSRPQSKRLREGHKLLHSSNEPNLWFMSLFVHSLLIPWHHLQENNSQTLWFVQDIQMLWYDWCKLKIGKSVFFVQLKKKKNSITISLDPNHSPSSIPCGSGKLETYFGIAEAR